FMDSEGRVKALRDYPKEEFTKLRVGFEPNPAFPNQEAHRSSILFLDDLLSRWSIDAPTLNIEIKSKAIWEDRFQSLFSELGDQLLKTLEPYNLRIQLQSFDWRLVQQLGLLSAYPVNWICESPREWQDFKAGYRFLNPFLHGLSLYHGIVDEASVQWCQERDLDLGVWTCNDMEEVDRLLDIGVRNFITDRPQVLLDHVEQRGFTSSTDFFL
ncbi:MAG: glycerophosphodiester phosphodiesterase, partial [Flavobacteriales bacterium]|nr:glycerophosphodiester phosphodiesterase [Flavobacteriales bacterium]